MLEEIAADGAIARRVLMLGGRQPAGRQPARGGAVMVGPYVLFSLRLCFKCYRGERTSASRARKRSSISSKLAAKSAIEPDHVARGCVPVPT